MGLRHEVRCKIGVTNKMTGQDGPAEGRTSGATIKNSFLFIGWVSNNGRLYKEIENKGEGRQKNTGKLIKTIEGEGLRFLP